MRYLVLLTGLLVSFNTAAQCFKDIECKGDRICNQGVCTAPSRVKEQSSQSYVAVLKENEWSNDISNAITLALQDQLSCVSQPEPGKALRALRTRGVIGIKPIMAVDGMNIFAVSKPISVFGFKALQVTGWEESSDKSLFWRGPGTAPPLSFQVVVSGDVATVKSRVEKKVSSRTSFEKASYSKYASSATEITCYGS